MFTSNCARHFARAAAPLVLALCAAAPLGAQGKHVDMGVPTRTGSVGVSIAVRNSATGEAHLLGWEIHIDAATLAMILMHASPSSEKARLLQEAIPAEFLDKVSVSRSGNRLTPVPATGFGDESIDYYKDETNEGPDTIFSSEPEKQDGLFSLEGVTSGMDASGGPGFVMLDVGGAVAFVPTMPGLAADLVEDDVLAQLVGQGVAAHLSTTADRLLENYGPNFVGDGRVLVIEDFPASGMVVDLKDTGLEADVVGVIDRTAMAIGTNFCGPAVPNSSGQPAEIRAIGSEVVGLQSLSLKAVNLPQDQFGYFLGSMTEGFVANPGGSSGNLCLGGQIGRFVQQVQNSGSVGAIQIEVDPLVVPVTPPRPILPGETWRFQCWFRDIEVAPTSNFTDGIWIEWQ